MSWSSPDGVWAAPEAVVLAAQAPPPGRTARENSGFRRDANLVHQDVYTSPNFQVDSVTLSTTQVSLYDNRLVLCLQLLKLNQGEATTCRQKRSSLGRCQWS